MVVVRWKWLVLGVSLMACRGDSGGTTNGEQAAWVAEEKAALAKSLPAAEKRDALMRKLAADVPQFLAAGPKSLDLAGRPPIVGDRFANAPPFNALIASRAALEGPVAWDGASGAILGEFQGAFALPEKLRGFIADAKTDSYDRVREARLRLEEASQIRYLVVVELREHTAPRIETRDGKTGFVAGHATLGAVVFDLNQEGKHLGTLIAEASNDDTITVLTRDGEGLEGPAGDKLRGELAQRLFTALQRALGAP